MRYSVRQYCAHLGRDPLLVQGAGGNVSWKEYGTLWIKASGTWLADAAREDVFVPMELDELKAVLAQTDEPGAPEPRLPAPSAVAAAAHSAGVAAAAAYSAAVAAADATAAPSTAAAADTTAAPGGGSGSARRPSIETLMHVVMPHTVVAHLHAVEPLAVLVRADARAALQARLGSRTGWEWVEYRRPGAPLARAVARALERTPGAHTVFLQNHGILVGGDTTDDVDARVWDLCRVLRQDLAADRDAQAWAQATGAWREEYVGPLPPPLFQEESLGYAAHEDAWVQRLVHIPALRRRLREAWALYPDHVVFLGPDAPVFRTRSEAAEYARAHRPPVLFVEGDGVFVEPGFDKARRAQLRCYYEVLARQGPQDVLVELGRQDVHDLVHWEAEQYRRERP